MERAAAEAAYNKLHETRGFHDGSFTRWSAERTAEFPVAANEGVSFGVADRDLTPWDKFTTDENASPLPDTGLATDNGAVTDDATEVGSD